MRGSGALAPPCSWSSPRLSGVLVEAEPVFCPHVGPYLRAGNGDDARALLWGKAVRHMRKRPCPVTSRSKPRASIKARFRCTAARLAPVRCSAIGAETTRHSAHKIRSADGVRPERGIIMAAARADQAP